MKNKQRKPEGSVFDPTNRLADVFRLDKQHLEEKKVKEGHDSLPAEHRRAIKELGPDLIERLFAEIEKEENSSDDEPTFGCAVCVDG